jgi:predicted transcriptional regulator
MKDERSITAQQRDEVLNYFIEHPDFTVGEAMEKFKINKDVSFFLMKEASKKL